MKSSGTETCRITRLEIKIQAIVNFSVNSMDHDGIAYESSGQVCPIKVLILRSRIIFINKCHLLKTLWKEELWAETGCCDKRFTPEKSKKKKKSFSELPSCSIP